MRGMWLCAALVVVVAACGDTGSTPTAATTTVSPTSAPTSSSTVGATSTTRAVDTTTITTSAVPRPDIDACVLVDESDAASILGSEATVDATPVVGFGETSVCSWITENRTHPEDE